MLTSTKVRSWLSFITLSFLPQIKMKKDERQLPLYPPDITGEVYRVEDQWLFINGEVYVDITEADMVDEKGKLLVVKDIREGDNVVVWIVEHEIIKTYPALGTANYIQRKNVL